MLGLILGAGAAGFALGAALRRPRRLGITVEEWRREQEAYRREREPEPVRYGRTPPPGATREAPIPRGLSDGQIGKICELVEQAMTAPSQADREEAAETLRSWMGSLSGDYFDAGTDKGKMKEYIVFNCPLGGAFLGKYGIVCPKGQILDPRTGKCLPPVATQAPRLPYYPYPVGEAPPALPPGPAFEEGPSVPSPRVWPQAPIPTPRPLRVSTAFPKAGALPFPSGPTPSSGYQPVQAASQPTVATYGPAGTMTAPGAFQAVATPGAYRPPAMPGLPFGLGPGMPGALSMPAGIPGGGMTSLST